MCNVCQENDMLHLPGWKKFRTLAKKQGRMMRGINLAKLKKYSTRAMFKYGYEVPKDFKHALEIDQGNDNMLLQDATGLALGSMEDYQVFTDNGCYATPPPDYEVIREH